MEKHVLKRKQVNIIMKRNLLRSISYLLIIGAMAAFALVTPACISTSMYTPPSGVTLSSIKVTLASNSSIANALRIFFDIFKPSVKQYTDYPAEIRIGSKEQFVAIGTYSDTAYAPITASATWASSNTAVATISQSGLATGVAAGTTNITATMNGITSPPETLTVSSP